MPQELKPRRACPKCGSYNTVYNGTTSTGKQKYHCRSCGVFGTFGLERKIKSNQPDADDSTSPIEHN